ncbi:MAG TPA: hypothetical protein IGP91_07315 [Thermosynechococcus sp. M46_R2017_013]|nr:hypothetical protein [Thermosynechococcus sp. M46_R2017_013]
MDLTCGGRLFRLGQIAVKAVARQAVPAIAISRVATELTPLAHVSVYSKGQWHKVLVYGRDRLPAHHYY